MNHSYPEYLAGPVAYCGSSEINNSTQHINSKQMRENWDKTTYYDFSRGHISNISHSRESINNISRKLPMFSLVNHVFNGSYFEVHG